MHPVHLARYVALMILVVAAVIAATVIDAALGVVLALVAFGLLLVIMPFVVIHFEEHDERFGRRWPPAHR